jgi:hypothetical protein
LAEEGDRVVDAATLSLVVDFPAGDTPDGGVVNPLNRRAHMVNSMSNDLTVLDGSLISGTSSPVPGTR